MPGTSATGSTEIAIVDSKIVADLCQGKFFVDATPTVYIASGAESVLGANVEILNPYGIVVKPYGDNYEIAPDLSGAMDGVISFNIPTQASNYQYGTYTVNLKMFDSTGASWVVTKTVKICAPDKENKSRNYGSLSARMDADCVGGKLYIIVDGVPTYNGTIMESQVLTGTLEYPTSSELSPLSITTGNFSVTLFEGVYKLTGEICATYNYGDNVFVKVKYKIKKEKNVRCLIDDCCILTAMVALQDRIDSDCTDKEKEETMSIIVEALSLYEMIKLSAKCGEDPSDYVEKLEKLLRCKCTCNCAEGTPIIGTSPSSDVIIQGCNVDVDENGNTTTYTINNYEYKVSINDNGGALTVASATLDSCTKTQVITFNIATVYSQIKTLANQNNTEADIWAAVINKSLRDVDPACLGITAEAWQALTFAQKWTAVLTKLCACCGTCDATIEDAELDQSGNDVILTWTGNAYLYEVYLNGLLIANILASAWPGNNYSATFPDAANGSEAGWTIIAYCSDKSIGDTEQGTFQRMGCPEVAAVILNTEMLDEDNVISAGCPFDLDSLVSLSNTETVEWHTANNTLAGTIVSNPASAGGGSYYAFNKNEDGCYSPGTRITVNCTAEDSCTAPQNLEVVVFGLNNFFVKFQSAAYPPPGNSYTVKRRLMSDPDVGGSYVTIGTPVWNASLNRWVIADVTAVNNTLYAYRAISNCGSTEPSIDFRYAYVVCPSVTLYPTDTTVAYSFVPVSTATQILVEIFDSSGTVLIHTDTYEPVFDNPIEGLFEYLDPETTYKVRLKIILGNEEFTKTCGFQSVTTDPNLS